MQGKTKCIVIVLILENPLFVFDPWTYMLPDCFKFSLKHISGLEGMEVHFHHTRKKHALVNHHSEILSHNYNIIIMT